MSVPDRYGFGRELLEKALPKELLGQAQLTFGPDGIRYVIEWPITISARADLANGRKRRVSRSNDVPMKVSSPNQ